VRTSGTKFFRTQRNKALTDGTGGFKDQVVVRYHDRFGIASGTRSKHQRGAIAWADHRSSGIEGSVTACELAATLEQRFPCHAYNLGGDFEIDGGGLVMGKMEEEEKQEEMATMGVTAVITLFTLRPSAPSMCSTGGASPHTTMPLSTGSFCAQGVSVDKHTNTQWQVGNTARKGA
jgi:hypothetical protein